MNLTKHGKEQSIAREFSPEMMAKISSGKHIILESNSDSDAFLIVGKYDGKFWAIVMGISSGKVITVRRAHKKEERIYVEKFGKC